MASIDLRDAYYTIPVAKHCQKYLKFRWRGRLYCYTCMPNGLACAPRVFTKIMKVVFSYLRQHGYISSGYLDDVFLLGDTTVECADNVKVTSSLLTDLGFVIHLVKSITIPTQVLGHLGFVLNSCDMTVTISEDKHQMLIGQAQAVMAQPEPCIRAVARLVGMMVANVPAVEFAELFYRQIEIEKALALKHSCGNFDANMVLSPLAHQDITWWIDNARVSKRKISHGAPQLTLSTDASMSGWGAALENNVSTGGRWTLQEQEEHINVLEMQAALLGLQALCADLRDTHLKLLMDNTTAVAYVRQQGGSRSLKCNAIARDILQFCLTRNIWLSVSHIAGVDNVLADKESRVFNDQTEWMLDPEVYRDLTLCLGVPDADMFASRINHQCPKYCAWRPDPNAFAVDAFTVTWTNTFVYCFPPFSLVHRVLQKIQLEDAEAVVVVPYWTTQPWFAKLARMLIDSPLLLPRKRNLLTLPFDRAASHPLAGRLRLMACRLSGKDSRAVDFRTRLKTSCWPRGGHPPRNSTMFTSRNGLTIHVDRVSIPLNQL